MRRRRRRKRKRKENENPNLRRIRRTAKSRFRLHFSKANLVELAVYVCVCEELNNGKNKIYIIKKIY